MKKLIIIIIWLTPLSWIVNWYETGTYLTWSIINNIQSTPIFSRADISEIVTLETIIVIVILIILTFYYKR